jgi:catechol 2,3-dioxygenase
VTSSTTIAPATALGAVHLTVPDLKRAAAFYEQRLGLARRAGESNWRALGVGGRDLVVLWEDREAKLSRGTTGLYHLALRVPSRRELARTLAHLVATRTALSGASDHGVSEALYLFDPFENGIEIYRDRPREDWSYEHGALKMTTDPLDLEGLMAELEKRDEEWKGIAAETDVGHVHLHVADLAQAERFYVDVLGFRLTSSYATALFFSAGGYHHHIGVNIWAGAGAPPPPPHSIGLHHFTVTLPGRADLASVKARLSAAHIETEEVGGASLMVNDPSSNRIVLEVGAG